MSHYQTERMYPNQSNNQSINQSPIAGIKMSEERVYIGDPGFDLECGFFGQLNQSSANQSYENFDQPIYQSINQPINQSNDRTPGADSQSSSWESMSSTSTQSNRRSLNGTQMIEEESLDSQSNQHQHSNASNDPSINQSINQSTHRNNHQSINQSSQHNHSSSVSQNVSSHDQTNRSISHSINQSANQSTNQSINQSTNHSYNQQSFVQQNGGSNYVIQGGEAVTRYPPFSSVSQASVIPMAVPIARVIPTMAHQVTDQSINQSVNQSVSQSINQPNGTKSQTPVNMKGNQGFTHASTNPSNRPAPLSVQSTSQSNDIAANDQSPTNNLSSPSNNQSINQSLNNPHPSTGSKHPATGGKHPATGDKHLGGQHPAAGGKRPRPPVHSEVGSKRPRKSLKSTPRLTPQVVSELIQPIDDNPNHWMSVSQLKATIQPFVDSVREACDITPANTTSIIGVFCHLFETMQDKVFELFLTQLGYEPAESREGTSANRVVWRSEEDFLPIVSLPFSGFRFHWTKSPDTAYVHEDKLDSFFHCSRLKLWRDTELNFIRDSCGQIIGRPLDEALEPGDVLVPPNEIDLSCLIFPYYVQVNERFQRLFGFTQADIKKMFHLNGKDAMSRLIDGQDLKKINDWDLREGMSKGVVSNTHYAKIVTKYGRGIQALVHHQVSGAEAIVGFPIHNYTFFTLPSSNDPIVPAGFPLAKTN